MGKVARGGVFSSVDRAVQAPRPWKAGAGSPWGQAELSPLPGAGHHRRHEGHAALDGRGKGLVVLHAVERGLGVHHVEGHRLRPAPLAEGKDGAQHLPGPGPGPAVLLASPVQAGLVHQDDLDLRRGRGGPGQAPHAPHPGGVLPGLQEAAQPQGQGEDRPAQPHQQAVAQAPVHPQIRAMAAWKRCWRAAGAEMGTGFPMSLRAASMRSLGAGCVAPKPWSPGFSRFCIWSSMSTRPSGL